MSADYIKRTNITKKYNSHIIISVHKYLASLPRGTTGDSTDVQ